MVCLFVWVVFLSFVVYTSCQCDNRQTLKARNSSNTAASLCHCQTAVYCFMVSPVSTDCSNSLLLNTLPPFSSPSLSSVPLLPYVSIFHLVVFNPFVFLALPPHLLFVVRCEPLCLLCSSSSAFCFVSRHSLVSFDVGSPPLLKWEQCDGKLCLQ